ncbi:putative hscarg dehydrogenase [Armillaria luteobubalina]|uniref:Hscarg dehydrogenase n=1 Tax=Armillaria luteobubalina TaxID=153913 RepID=A0AA39Q246_9AGAR|nr:putative hscarg dehydrogenase [Armillaria luteobubalina]KAK0493849.1 putative hscarg dehydrogenase [Armillaria luteobubalina]
MPPNIVVVFGATGKQGGSVVSALLKSPSYKVRAVTRNITSPKSKELVSRGAEVVYADLDDYDSVVNTLKDAYAVFGLTNTLTTLATVGPEEASKAEINQGKNIANAAASTPTVQHFIWSTLPYTRSFAVPHFDSKAAVDEYILTALPSLATKTTFFYAGYYASNLLELLSPMKDASSGKYTWVQPCSRETRTPMMGLTEINVGVFVEAILENPTISLPSKYVLGSVDDLSFGDLLKLWAETLDVEAEYVQVSGEEYAKTFFAGELLGRELAVMENFWEVEGFKGYGDSVLTKEDLGIDATRLVTTKQAFERFDWGTVVPVNPSK